jgi:hypothetical protein
MNPASATSLARTNYCFNLGDSQYGTMQISQDQDTTRGPFCRGFQYTLASLVDGTSNTIMFAEVATSGQANFQDESTELNPRVQGRGIGGTAVDSARRAVNVDQCKARARGGIYPTGTTPQRFCQYSGTRWLEGWPTVIGVHTIVGPNGASCWGTEPWNEEGIFTTGSYHLGGAHIVTFDNSVKFVPNEIDTSYSGTGLATVEYYSPGRDPWGFQTPNWNSTSPFGVWGALGTRGSGDDVGEMPGS